MRKPRVFVGSSAESLAIADAINVNFDHEAEVSVWKNGFSISSNNIDSLIEKAKTVDFAIFVFTPDDAATIRDQAKHVVRDNVLYELGLFTGTLGKERCFIVKPRDVELHFPTDLLGLTPADYDGNRSDGDLASAINSPCILIKKEITKYGLITSNIEIQKKQLKSPVYNYKIGDIEHRLLVKVLEKNYVCMPGEFSVWEVFNDINDVNNDKLSMASIKLEKIGLLSKEIYSNEHHEFYVFTITTDGLDYLLENEHLIENAPF